MRIRCSLFLASAVVITVGLAGCSGTEPNPTPTQTPGFDVAAAKAHCEQTGGTVQQRQPMSNTNASDTDEWVPLGEPVEVCRYETLDDEFDTRIYADLATVWSDKPTLAALAYLGSPPPAESPDGTSPASDPMDQVFGACVFADGSFIDEWGIAYRAVDELRGKDLTEVFRFDQENLPEIFFGE